MIKITIESNAPDICPESMEFISTEQFMAYLELMVELYRRKKAHPAGLPLVDVFKFQAKKEKLMSKVKP